jgi:hypothetical protein
MMMMALKRFGSRSGPALSFTVTVTGCSRSESISWPGPRHDASIITASLPMCVGRRNPELPAVSPAPGTFFSSSRVQGTLHSYIPPIISGPLRDATAGFETVAHFITGQFCRDALLDLSRAAKGGCQRREAGEGGGPGVHVRESHGADPV